MDSQLVQGLGGLIGAIGMLLSGVAAMFRAWQIQRKEHGMKPKTHTEKILWIAGSALVILGISIFAVRAASKNEELTTGAWNAFSAKDYQSAISRCTELVAEFEPAAKQDEATLVREKAIQIPRGVVPEPIMKTAFERGLVNDVGACFFIIGRSAEFQNRTEVARAAYSRAIDFTYARVWDPAGKFFWSPAEASAARLNSLK